MAEEAKVSAEKAAEMAGKPEPKFFEFGDAFFECNRCGNYERLQKGVKDGMQFVLPTSDQHEWRLVCGKCKNMMRIFFKESDEETVIEAKAVIAAKEAEAKKKAEDEALEKAKKEEAGKKKRRSKKSKDEPKKEHKEEELIEGSVEHNAGADQSDGAGEATLDIVN